MGGVEKPAGENRIWLALGGWQEVLLVRGGTRHCLLLSSTWCSRGLSLLLWLLWGVQALMVHWSFPKVVNEDLRSWWAQDPSGPSKVKEIEETCPSWKDPGLHIHEGSWQMVSVV